MDEKNGDSLRYGFFNDINNGICSECNSFTVDGRTLANNTSENIILGSGGGLVVGHGSANAGPAVHLPELCMAKDLLTVRLVEQLVTCCR